MIEYKLSLMLLYSSTFYQYLYTHHSYSFYGSPHTYVTDLPIVLSSACERLALKYYTDKRL